jgi:hypothetical protein
LKILKTQVLGDRLRNGSNLRISQTKYLISDLINIKRLSDLTTFANGSNYCRNFFQLLNFDFICYKERIRTKSRKELLTIKLKFGGNQLNYYNYYRTCFQFFHEKKSLSAIIICNEKKMGIRQISSSNIKNIQNID